VVTVKAGQCGRVPPCPQPQGRTVMSWFDRRRPVSSIRPVVPGSNWDTAGRVCALALESPGKGLADRVCCALDRFSRTIDKWISRRKTSCRMVEN